ncbi:MAG: restriction endonuclease [Candidatus Omnitrophica bacterium]|nr:restriction endonuclease [Candidatus Omnitrophota bacterium]
MAREKRKWHPDFVRYMEFIVANNNYKDLPNKFRGDGKILWVSPSDKVRAAWWDKKVKDMKCINRAEVARQIHPKKLSGLKPCQICGKKLSIFYVYPNKNTLKKLNIISTKLQFSRFDDIENVFDKLYTATSDDVFLHLLNIFKIPNHIKNARNKYIQYIKNNCTTKLSPGVMSNPPDRLDGFHTYNACCRGKEDTGRHTDNLARYAQDRRAYENWAEGNWNLANRLMGEYGKYRRKEICPQCGKLMKLTADHIGPISLGFTHRPCFKPLCKLCNSGKNNRMSLEDVKSLIEDEKNGHWVISWHSKCLWDALKNIVKTNYDAWRLSRIMRVHLHHVLTLLSIVAAKGYTSFLKEYLHPEHSFYDYKFKNFHPLKPADLKIIRKPLDSRNKRKNAQRYIRISFESLKDYESKENRNVKGFRDPKIKKMVQSLFEFLKNGKYLKAQQQLYEVIEVFSIKASSLYS